jgi:hypothetical protein
MGFLNKKMTWTNTEFIPFKVCIAAIYLYLGASYPAFFTPYKTVLLGLFGLCLLIVMRLWIKKMKA